MPLSQQKKVLTISILTILCIVLSVYFQSKDIGIVYTHLFYIPIILSCIWWQEKGIIVAVLLGIIITASHILLRQEVSILNDALRSLILVIIAIFVSKISISEKKKSILLKQQTERMEKNLETLEEKNEQIKTAYLGLRLKNVELEKWQKIIKDREVEIAILKKQIKEILGLQNF